MIEIKHRLNGKVLYTAENAQDVRAALVEAASKRADLRGADLQGADLRGDFNSPDHPLHAFRADCWSILDQVPGEVAFLREAIVKGEINGSVYKDESGCGCLTGTIALHTGCDISDFAERTGVIPDSGRPAEQWFIDIVKGDKPLPLDTKEWPSESVFRSSYAKAWLDEWVESRTAIAAALIKGEK